MVVMRVLILLLLLCNTSFSRVPVISDFQLNGPIIQYNNANVLLSGTFDDTSYDKLNKLLNQYKNYNIIIYANSNGGIFRNHNNIVQIMDLIHNHNITWIVSGKARCYSMCAFAGVASKKVSGVLHFHGVTIDNVLYKDENILSRLKSYGYNINFNSIVNKTDLTAIRFE
jgi:hypothetical protein